MKRIRQILIALTALFAVPVLFFASGSSGSPVWLVLGFVLAAAGCCLVGVALVKAARSFSVKTWGSIGLLLLAGLFIPTALLVNLNLNLSPAVDAGLVGLLSMLIYLLLPAALISAALLLHHGLVLAHDGLAARKDDPTLPGAPRLRVGLPASGCMLLAILLLVKSAHNIYWLMVWDNTYDPLTFFWLSAPVLAALVAGVMLTYTTPGSAKLAGLYSLCVPLLLIAVSVLAQNVDFRQLTEKRAAQLDRALQTYYTREGRYPQTLRQLIPWDTLSLPGPVIISAGQGWCYDGGEGYYRLGYVDRRHWSDPNLSAVSYAQRGSMPDLPPICSLEAAGIAQHNPELYRVETK